MPLIDRINRFLNESTSPDDLVHQVMSNHGIDPVVHGIDPLRVVANLSKAHGIHPKLVPAAVHHYLSGQHEGYQTNLAYGPARDRFELQGKVRTLQGYSKGDVEVPDSLSWSPMGSSAEFVHHLHAFASHPKREDAISAWVPGPFGRIASGLEHEVRDAIRRFHPAIPHTYIDNDSGLETDHFQHLHRVARFGPDYADRV